MRKIIRFFINPEEDSKRLSFIKIILLFSAFSFIYGAILLTYNHLGLFSVSDSEPSDYSQYNVFIIWLIPPVFEEAIFRLPLKKNKYYLFISLIFIIWLFYKNVNLEAVYVENYYSVKIILTVLTTFVLFPLLTGIYKKCSTKSFLYFSLFLFAILHIFNMDYLFSANFSIFIIIYILLYIGDKLVAGLFFSYTRMKYGFFYSCMLHAIGNSPILLFGINY